MYKVLAAVGIMFGLLMISPAAVQALPAPTKATAASQVEQVGYREHRRWYKHRYWKRGHHRRHHRYYRRPGLYIHVR